jgi:uncharacterized membrane protein YgdD (TMEM256/DUF423 family)
MNKSQIAFACIYIATGIIFGALGAHALKSVLSVDQLNSFETAVRYQIFAGFGLITFNVLNQTMGIQSKLPSILLIVGSLLFSFSIYALLICGLLDLPKTIFIPLTPIGGVLMIVAWFLQAWKTIKT